MLDVIAMLHNKATDQILYSLTHYPATLVLIIFQSLIFLYMFNYNIQYDAIAYQYTSVVQNKQLHRIYTSTFTHLSIYHIGFNMYALWQLNVLELQFGTLTYIIYTLLLINGSMLILTLISYILIRMGYEQYNTQYSVGYSCVVFGLMAIQCVQYGFDAKFNIFGITAPFFLSPFVSLLFTQLIVQNASFIGHFAGIIIGYIIGLALFEWCNNIVGLIVLLVVSVLVFTISLVSTTEYKIAMIQTLIDKWQTRNEPKITIVNGNIVYRSLSSNEQV